MNLFKRAMLIAALGSAFQTVTAQDLQAGAFNEAQAVRGQALYYEHCLMCHGEQMNGVDQAPPLAGPNFVSNWMGESLMALVERMGTMPPEKPGTLSRQENVDLLSYMLWFNNFSLGSSELGASKEVLENITLTAPPF